MRDAYAGYAATDCIGKSGTSMNIGQTAIMLQAIFTFFFSFFEKYDLDIRGTCLN